MACLCGMPQAAAGPESGVDMPNLITLSAALTWLGPLITSSTIAHNTRLRSVINLFIIVSPLVWVFCTPHDTAAKRRLLWRPVAGHYKKHYCYCQWQFYTLSAHLRTGQGTIADGAQPCYRSSENELEISGWLP